MEENKPALVEWFDDHFYKITRGNEVKYIPSVTTKLGATSKPFLAKWRGDIGNREADYRLFEAQQRGTRIHNAWYVLTSGGAVIYQPWNHPIYTQEQIAKLFEDNGGHLAILQYQEEMYQVVKLKKWLEVVRPKIIASEKIVYDWERNDAGTVDNILEIKPGSYQVNGKTPVSLEGGTYIVDLKTGSQVDDDAYMQTAAYGVCVTVMGEIPLPNTGIAGTIILHTGSKNRNGIEGLGTLFRTREEMHQDYHDYRHVAAIWERKNKDMQPKIFDFPALISMKP